MASKARVVSAAFALSGFTVALVSGLSAGNVPFLILLRALLALFICQVIGAIVGAMVDRIVEENEARYAAANPVPVVPALTPASREGVVLVDEAVDEQGATRAGA